MSLLHGPSIVTSGLVFYYDANNIKKSYLGRPVTNLITNGDFANGMNAGTGGTGGDNPLNEIVVFPNPGDTEYCLRSTAVGGNAFTEYQMDLSGLAANTTYVMSCWYYFDPAWNGGQAVFHSRAYSASGANTATGSDTGTLLETRTVNGVVWRRAYQTITTPADATGVFNWYLGYPSGNTAGFRYFSNIQMEIGSFPTPFVRGARSATTAIRDLVNRNTVTINSLTYVNDATTSFSFNGSTDKLTLGTSTLLSGAQDYTIDAVFRITTAGSVDYIFGNYGTANSGGLEYYVHQNKLNNYISTNVQSATNLNPNQWYISSVVRNGSTVTHYLNGQPDGSGTNGSSISTINPFTIGNSHDYTSEAFGGNIAAVKVYNRALSAAEVQQNFNALRGRYGL